MKISYAITVCDEIQEVRRLVRILLRHRHADDDIVIQYDQPKAPPPLLDYLNQLASTQPRITIVPFALNQDFATFKNNLQRFCQGDYIFQIDADEYPCENLLLNLHRILADNSSIDLLIVPRINTVRGLTPAHIRQWGWRLDANNWVNFPDPQGRIYRNRESIQWMRPVHEILIGYDVAAHLPWVADLALIHPKTIERQEQQNQFYAALLHQL